MTDRRLEPQVRPRPPSPSLLGRGPRSRDPSGATPGARRPSPLIGLAARLPIAFSRTGSGVVRDLLFVSLALLAIGRLVHGSVAVVLALLLGAAVLLGTRASFRADDPDAEATVPPESGLVAAVLAAALLLGERFVPLTWAFVPALLAAGGLLWFAVLAERHAIVHAPDASPRLPLLVVSICAAIIGFTAAAALIDGAFGPGPISETGLLALAAIDGVIAALLSYRLGRIEPAPPRVALVGAITSGLVVALAAGLVRAVAVPTSIWPALLTVVFYLWDAVRTSTVAVRRDPRWVWQFGLLGVLAIVVVGWNLALR